MENSEKPCPCFSGKAYEVCCKPFHQGTVPGNALLLMRSRYSAYALNIPDYIIETTHPASPQYSDNKFSWKRSISQFSTNSTFQDLKILDFKERDTLAVVTFTAVISQEGQDATFTETSFFEKRNHRWLYRTGQLAQGYAPNLVMKDPFRMLPLAYYGDPILRKKADLIPKITPDIEKLIEEMVETMVAFNAKGIAAPQVHQSLRLFVIRQPLRKDDIQYEPGEVKVFINPILSLHSTETCIFHEGCLSIPGQRFEVVRPKEVMIEYTTIVGKRVQERISGWEARIVLHEYDHIEGILFFERLKPEEMAKLMPILQNLEKRIHNFQG